MEFSEIKNVAEWFFALLATTGISLLLGAFNLIKSGKMLPRDIKKADLENKSKEVGIAEQFGKLASDAAEKALKLQERINMLESTSTNLQANFTDLKEKVEVQEVVISEQATIIEEQSKRLDLQDAKIIEQQEEIEILRCELDNSRQYNDALIKQMQEAHIIPIEGKSLSLKKCKEKKRDGQNGNKV